MKQVSQIVFVFLITFSFACGGGGSKEKEKADTTQAKETAGNTSEGEKLCFFSKTQFHTVSANLIIKGNTVTGMMRYITPKAGAPLYTIYNVKGTKTGEKLALTLTVIDNETGQGLGELWEGVWIMKGDELSPEKEDVSGVLKKMTCAENASFEAKAASETIAPRSYEFDGLMNGKIKIKMFLTSKPNPEDKRTILYEGYYYYLSQGKDKKIELKGVTNVFNFLQLDEVVGEKTFGKFMIEQAFTLDEEFTCTWISADDKKQMQTVLKSAK
ncbi:MAG: hypothetical protein MUE85_11830 [Microscillaceae bacterium]|nr:hypothetical protein [Microscillaceae bacterium]